MPIRQENRHRYPADWKAISLAIRQDRAGWRCECAGECGRDAGHLADDARCVNRHGEPAWGTGSKVVLTTAHLNHIPENVDPENLRAMCQACHLSYDRDLHAATRAATKAARADYLAMSADRHNHITRDIKPFGAGCLACDKHWGALRGSAVVFTSETGSPAERADCPDHGVGHDDCHQDCLACCGHECDDTCFPDDNGVDVSAEATMSALATVINGDVEHDSMCPLLGKTIVKTVGEWPEQRQVQAPYVVGAYGCRCALIARVTARCVDRAQQAVNTFIKAFDHKADCECVGCESADLVVTAVAGQPIDGYFPTPCRNTDTP